MRKISEFNSTRRHDDSQPASNRCWRIPTEEPHSSHRRIRKCRVVNSLCAATSAELLKLVRPKTSAMIRIEVSKVRCGQKYWRFA